jgi:RimJ/RimL family protein N-acetyltransferase
MIVEFSQLETERLRIRRFSDDDLEAYFVIRNSPEVTAFEGEYTLERGRKLIESMQGKELGAPGWFQFALEEKSSGELIGDMAFNFIELPQTAEMGYSLAPSQWGKGLAFEATAKILELAFTKLELHRVMAYTSQANQRSQRLLERHRFRLEGRTLESYRVNGIWIDEFQYALLEREWLSKPTAV